MTISVEGAETYTLALPLIHEVPVSNTSFSGRLLLIQVFQTWIFLTGKDTTEIYRDKEYVKYLCCYLPLSLCR